MNMPSAQLEIDSKENLGPRVVGTIVAFTVLALISVLLRTFARIRFTRLVGWDDFFIALAMFFTIMTAAFQIEQVKWGAGKHTALLDLTSITNSLKYMYRSILTYFIGLTLTKVSILMQYRRIFSAKRARIPIYVVMAFTVAGSIEGFFTVAFMCKPVDAFWNVLKRLTATCLDRNVLLYLNSIWNMIAGLLIAALPVRGIWRLQLVRRQKVALIAVLTLGWIVCIVSAIRIYSLVVQARNELDFMFYSAPPLIWGAIEMNLAIVCACVPALKPLVVHVLPAFASKPSENKSSQQSRVFNWSGFSRSFLLLEDKNSYVGKGSDEEQGSVGDELPTITAPPAVYRQYSKTDYIRVTHYVQ
ncbi:hypothetical protein DM02DRAFT_711795 [Periconia macrospinosa]|uniref:Rhodopsin domain-containing protein n=1 Tax=Periconia macrospinosa TaxID=97972 RepID=A0A2V1DN36_9PLEO|nr:hypothetical protein DM02DRAFT_711795 [Periconia macrospinosa]